MPHGHRTYKKAGTGSAEGCTILPGCSRGSSVTDMLKDIYWETLAERREKNRLTMMYKIQNDIVDIQKELYAKVALQ